jgi:HSP20 family protein
MRNLTLWNDHSTLSPWLGLMDLQKNLDRMLDQTFCESRNDRWNDEVAFHPACEIEETDSHFVMSIDIPGVSKKDINIEVKDNQVYISGERKSEKRSPRFSELSHGKFFRSVTLPTGIEPDKIEAQYQDGVLSLALPKVESARPRQIKITEGKSTFFGKFLGGNQGTDKEKTISASSAASSSATKNDD